MIIKIPNEAQFIIDTLQDNGFEAYVVGSCVRDSLLGKEPKKWDICTPALPEQTMKWFNGQHIIKTGLQYGTLTLVLNSKPFEISTYRAGGKYTNNRRSDKVKLVNVLKRDLARRDFSINAMAYSSKAGLIDYYGGQQDLADRKIRCAGNPSKKLQEDALRIMRALRLASGLGFSIDKDTSTAMLDNRSLLKNIAVERIAVEFNKFIIGDNVSGLLLKYMPVITEIIPELTPKNGLLLSIDAAPKDVQLRLTLLFHDYENPQVSSDMAKEALLRLKYDKDTIDTVTKIVLYHDADIQPVRKNVKQWLNKIGEEKLRLLIEVKKAAAMAQAEACCIKGLNDVDEALTLIDEVIEQKQCFSLKALAVNGRDLIANGVPEGVKIKAVLNELLDLVINEEIQNDKIILLEKAKKY